MRKFTLDGTIFESCVWESNYGPQPVTVFQDVSLPKLHIHFFVLYLSNRQKISFPAQIKYINLCTCTSTGSVVGAVVVMW